MIHFSNDNHPFTLPSEEQAATWLENTIIAENKELGDVDIVFTSDENLLDINIKYLNHNYLTDIITFDYCVEDIIHGELYISIDRVAENATLHDATFEKELHRVMVHGILHLLGYKDKLPEQQHIMREKEDYYLSLHPSFN